MNQETYRRIVSGESRGIGPFSARASLRVLSGFYCVGYEGRQAAYGLRLLSQTKVKARVVSVGNITAGGTGKTPATIYFARRFREEGQKTAVLSRGYGRLSPLDKPITVSDGKNLLVSPKQSGDEPYLVAGKLPGVPVVVCGKRVRGANYAIERFGAETIVLDDGFQHIAIARDDDIVVIDCTAPFGFGRLLPRGLLREPLRALKRATSFLLTHANQRRHADVLERLSEINPSAEVLVSRHRPVQFARLRGEAKASCDIVSGKRVLALSSIGNPQSFEQTLRGLGAEIAHSLRFRDHHWYDLNDIRAARRMAESYGADYIVSTEKDGVRLALAAEAPENLLLLEIELEIIGRYP